MNHTSPFRIVVCVKQVPGSAQAKIDPVTKTLIRSGKDAILNPYDGFAVEAALQIRDRLAAREHNPVQAQITALSMGVPSVEQMLLDLVARGVDEGVLLTDRAFAGADTIDTAYTLSLGVQDIEQEAGPVSLIICGHMAVDGDTAQIGPELAQTLNLPHVANVLRIDDICPEEQHITVTCISTEGRQTLQMKLPALITVSKDINVPRLPSIAGIRHEESVNVKIRSAEDLGADPETVGLKGAATRVVRTFTPDITDNARRIRGSADESAREIRNIIGELL